jgi:hypothetical protein
MARRRSRVSATRLMLANGSPPRRSSDPIHGFAVVHPGVWMSITATIKVVFVLKEHSIPIASVRRKRQRLPSSLLIENASAYAHFFPSALIRRGISDQG